MDSRFKLVYPREKQMHKHFTTRNRLRVVSVSDLVNDINENTKFSLAMSEFLHNTRRITLACRRKLIRIVQDEPQFNSQVSPYIYAYVAATVEKICNENKLVIPKWVNKEKYFLKTKWFPPEIDSYEQLKPILERKSPPEFKKRNLYVSENVLSIR